MYKTIMDVEGMMCGNCEKHMNEMIQDWPCSVKRPVR